jgi:uncharacterized protein
MGVAALCGCDKATTAPAQHAAIQASFDCSRAFSQTEKAVCADPEAARADRSMAAAYRKALTDFPAAFRLELKDSQRAYLAYADVLCRQSNGYETGCLAEAYGSRAEELRTPPYVDPSGRRYITVTLHQALPYEPSRRDAQNTDPYEQPTRSIVLVQIANPAKGGERAWNVAAVQAVYGLAARDGLTPENEGENVYKIDVIATAPGFIESQVSWKGPPRWGTEDAIHWNVARGRALEPTDLFEDPAGAFDAITKLALDDLRAHAVRGEPDRVPSFADARKATGDLSNWTFDARKIYINLGSDPPVFIGADIPWSKIKPLLKRDAAFDPAELKNVR